VIAFLGNLSRDVIGGEARAGGGPFHAARAARFVGCPVAIVGRCATLDRDEFLGAMAALDPSASVVPGAATAGFEMVYEGDARSMRVVELGDVWNAGELPVLPSDTRWVHLAPLTRGDFPIETVELLASRYRVSFDGQGLVRPRRCGPLIVDDAFDPGVLHHVQVLKLSDEEAAVIGDIDALGVREVVVTHGSRGATVHAEGRVEHVPVRALPVDPTGSGDMFCLGYSAARSSGADPFEAARIATDVVRAGLSA